MVSRSDVNKFVQQKINECLNGVEVKEIDITEMVSTNPDFKPSRGDEPYILKVKDESLRAIHTRMLDCIEEYEAAVWGEIEKNTR